MLAGMSVDYYVRLERGNLGGVSESVLESLARALQLDEAERAHLHDLARVANTGSRSRRRPVQRVRPSLQQLLDAMTDAPAFVRNGHLDILAANQLGHALYWPIFQSPHGPANTARFQFLDPDGPGFFPDWSEVANSTVAMLRTEAGRDPYNKDLTDLIGELCTRSEEFRVRWAEHNVRLHRTGVKSFHHPVVGDLTLAYEAMELQADPGLTLSAYTAEPGTPSCDGLKLLASWAATLDDDAPARRET